MKRVKLTLTSEQALEGTVVSVTAQSLQVRQLAGVESFDPVFRLGHASAVIVRGLAK